MTEWVRITSTGVHELYTSAGGRAGERSVIGRYDVDDPDDEKALTLAMRDHEARGIAVYLEPVTPTT